MALDGSVKRITEQSAKQLAKSNFWMKMNAEDIARFQLYQPLLCVPFHIFQTCLEALFDRPIYTHEFGLSNLIVEYEKHFTPIKNEAQWVGLIPDAFRNLIEFEEDESR